MERLSTGGLRYVSRVMALIKSTGGPFAHQALKNVMRIAREVLAIFSRRRPTGEKATARQD
jgi:hypothetical protein